MAYLICSNCGKEHSYSAHKGSKIKDLRTPCCQFPAAKGIMISVEENNFNDEWKINKRKIYIIRGRLQFAGYPAKVNIFKDDGDQIWFTQAHPSNFRPNWIGYYKISKKILEHIGWDAAQQEKSQDGE